MTPDPSRRRLLRVAGSGLAAALAGCPDGTSGTPTASGTPPPSGTSPASETPPTSGPTTAVDVSLEGAPAGLRKYRFTLSTAATVPIGSVHPGLLDGGEFEVVDGGTGSPTVTVRAADLSEAVGSFDATETLATVTFEGALSRDDLDLTVATLVDDGGEPMDVGRVSLAVSR